MLKLTFAEAGPGPTHEAGPFPEIAFDGNDLRALVEGGPLIARHRDHSWCIGERRFFRVDCDKATVAQFQDAKDVSEILGPFVHFSSADGIAFADGDNFAHIDPRTGLWFSRHHGRYWARLVVRAV